ncbi:hypothetical protein [Paenibacillus qinlingensis]|uniref:Glycine zipper-like domain-containing protein n=1 Tax=Paenibacillus qinlingensis TaxID=1837343 RepID=A0ABU1P7Q2_9BACL|nr:hypothetical protein [Paenibacillus qinlingensis]MDR6555082.1 hypothetical protein [Paenibacillus qinlingensis]
MENRVDHVKTLLRELRGTVSKSILKKLNLDKCERGVEKLDSFSSSCKDCEQQLLELMNCLMLIKEDTNRIEDTKLKPYKQLINHISSHLQIKHKLIREGYYTGIFMSLGMSFGVVFGLTVFDNIGIGISIGMCMGLAIGAGKDADAKKKGKTI